MLERFNNVSKHINEQQETLESYNKEYQLEITNKIKRLNIELVINQYCEQLVYDIEILNEHIKDISESIILAKLNIISKHILHPEEIFYIQNVLEKQNAHI